MKLIDALKKKGTPFKIANVSRDELPQFCKDMGFKTGAEIGVDHGDFLQKFVDAGLKMYGVDPWEGRDKLFQQVRTRFQKNKNCTIIRKTSMDAVNDFAARSLDFVYIDADHRFPYVANDLYYWYWRVKKGGIVSGHDYMDTRPDQEDRSLQVKTVVDAFVKAHNIGNYYVFGRSLPLDKEAKDDQMLSFMFVKNW